MPFEITWSKLRTNDAVIRWLCLPEILIRVPAIEPGYLINGDAYICYRGRVGGTVQQSGCERNQ
jgi:hypothetical protein